MSNTPETDQKAVPHIGFYSCATVPAEFARKLERERDEAIAGRHAYKQLAVKHAQERDEAREKIERQAERLRYLEGATNHASGTPLSTALKERDEAREELKHITEYGTEEINAAVELRQRLASALVERDEAREEAHRFRSLHYSHLGINGSASWFPWEGKLNE
jgi:hypothetical protein